MNILSYKEISGRLLLVKYRKIRGGVIVFALLEFLVIACLTVKYDLFNKSLIKLGITEDIPQVKGDYWCVKGWSNTLEKMRYHADVVFFGNSITYGSDFKKFFPDYDIVTLGYPGDNISGMINRYRQIGYVSPNKIFIMAGINDLAEGRMPEEIVKSYARLLDSIRIDNPNAKIFIQSILPVNHDLSQELPKSEDIKRTNLLLKYLIKKRNDVLYLDLFATYSDKYGEMPKNLSMDGLHLKSESYEIWANLIKDYL